MGAAENMLLAASRSEDFATSPTSAESPATGLDQEFGAEQVFP
jgi:hypothetical protein